MKIRPRIAVFRPKNACFGACYDLVMWKRFEQIVMTTIILNTILLTISWPNMPKSMQNGLDMANYCFTAFFFIECLIKISAFKCRYFRDGWNIFDFIIMVSSVLCLLIVNLKIQFFNNSSQVLRSLRIGRMFRLFRNLKQLRIIYGTFINTFSRMVNVGCLMFLTIYIYAVIGMNLFAGIKR